MHTFITSLQKDNLLYDLKANPLTYFDSMLHMNEMIESRDMKMMNIFPVTGSHIPGCIQIDSTVLAKIFKINYKGQLSDNHAKIWGSFFKLNHRDFRCFSGKGSDATLARKYQFAYSMQTDGVSASLRFRRKDLYEFAPNIDGPLGLIPNPYIFFWSKKIQKKWIHVRYLGIIDRTGSCFDSRLPISN